MNKLIPLVLVLTVTLVACGAERDAPAPPPPVAPEEPSAPEESLLLPWTEQLRIRESWLRMRHEMLPEMMRRHDIDMWIVINEEFNDDPLTEYIAPPRPYAGNRDIFIFIDTGDEADFRKVALTGYEEENLARFFELAQFEKPGQVPPRPE